MFFEGLLAIIIFAFVPLAIKFTMASPITICLFRLFFTVVVLAFAWRRKISFSSFYGKRDSWKLWLIGFIFFFHWISYAYAVKLGGPSIGVLGLSTYGVQLAIAGAYFLNHKLTKKDIYCLMVSMVGIILIIPSWDFKNDSTKGLMLALISATCFALMPIAHQKTKNYSMETKIFAQFFGSFVGFFLLIGKTNWHLKSVDWWILIFLGVFGTLVAHSLWAKVSSKAKASHVGLAYYTIAPLTIFLSHFLLADSFSPLQACGGVLVVLAAIINISIR